MTAPTDELIARLRNRKRLQPTRYGFNNVPDEECCEAADAIEALVKRVGELEEALKDTQDCLAETCEALAVEGAEPDALAKRVGELEHDNESLRMACKQNYDRWDHACGERDALRAEVERQTAAMVQMDVERDELRSDSEAQEREFQALQGEHEAAHKLLRDIAIVAHCGGLRNLSEAQVAEYVRRVTIPHWDGSGTEHDLAARVVAALVK